MHTSYSWFPSSHSKQEVPMKFWQRPNSNFKLECAEDPGRSIERIEDLYWRRKDRAYADSSIPYLNERVDTLSKAAICVLTITPFLSLCATALFTPLSIITAAGMYCALIAYIDEALPTLDTLKASYDLPSWLNECVDGEPIRQDPIDRQLARIDELYTEMNGVRIMMIFQICMITFAFVYAACFGCAYCFCNCKRWRY